MNRFRMLPVVILLGAATWLAHAQQPAAPATPGTSRKILARHDLTIPQREGVEVLTELAPGAKEPRHTHPGDLFGYVLEGTFTLVADGQATTTTKAGEVFYVPAGLVHSGQNLGDTPVKVVVTFMVEKGKPLTSPVQ